MPEFEPRALHLHTLDSLIADLVSGRGVITAGDKLYALPDARTRSALQWYRAKGGDAWGANLTNPIGEEIVGAVLKDPPNVAALPARPANANSRRLILKRMTAHRFAGLHKFGTPDAAPDVYTHDFTEPLTVLEGRNGSGKTSIENAVIWTLTGELLRPQRLPEGADKDFECWVEGGGAGKEATAHRLSPITPMPGVSVYRPEQAWVPADTWAELIFVDENGVELPPIRRSHSRNAKGVLQEEKPDLSVLGVDPIALRIGTVMPGMLSLIQVGSESELGRAVSELTGLSALIELAAHAKRAKKKVDGDLLKAKTTEKGKAESDFNISRGDLEREIKAHAGMQPPVVIPACSDDLGIEAVLAAATTHFVGLKASAFQAAQEILGKGFDASDVKLRDDLERNIGRALEYVGAPQRLVAVARLTGLRMLKPAELDTVDQLIARIVSEGKKLAALAKDPSAAARARLYARVAAWIKDHPDPNRKKDECVVCGRPLENALDPVSGRPVRDHLHDAEADAELIAQTVGRWAESTLGYFTKELPDALQREMRTDLSGHPCDLLRTAMVDELFDLEPFKGVLTALKPETAAAFDAAVAGRADLDDAAEIDVPPECIELKRALSRVERAVRFARWRQANEPLARKIGAKVLGRPPKDGEAAERATLTGKLLALDNVVKGTKPISDALMYCGRMSDSLAVQRAAQKRIAEYQVASAALGNLLKLGDLADQQVGTLRDTLSKEAAAWRNKIYLGAFPDTAHELVGTGLGRKGELDLVVRSDGVSAPAQHVVNASALRASLIGFFLAFWQYVLKERGGLATLLLDDPQDLLDSENRERLATALVGLLPEAQLVITSYEARFAAALCYAAKIKGKGVEHLEVHPATRLQPTARTTPPLFVIKDRQARFDRDRNAEEPARDFVDRARVFFETKLGDIFDDPASAQWAKDNPTPTFQDFVSRLRAQVRAAPNGLFAAPVFRTFVDHPALVDGSPLPQIMNKAHHGKRDEIRAAEVAVVADDLGVLLDMVEQMYGECYQWRRRDAGPVVAIEAPDALPPFKNPNLRVVVCPDLAAFTTTPPTGEAQGPVEPLDPGLLEGKALFYLRRDNFGFAAPAGALAIVEAEPGPVEDRRLVIARTGEGVYARRLVRAQGSTLVGLTAEVPDPRRRTPKTLFLEENAVALHQVVGIIFQSDVQVPQGPEEAVLIDETGRLEKVEVSFRVVEDSAVPLALKGQVVLGGKRIELNELGQNKDALVALTLADGASIFKRVGDALPGDLGYLRQFESIGGLGASEVLAVGKEHAGLRRVASARVILGVLYRA